MHLFLPYLLNNSQIICLRIHFSKTLHVCVTLICSDWSDWSISFKAAFVSVCTAFPVKFFNAPKAAPISKEWICIFIQTNAKIKFSQVCTINKWADNMLMFHVKVNIKQLGIRFKIYSDESKD